MSGNVFPTGLEQLTLGWTTDTFEWMLLKASWTPDSTVNIFVSDVAGGNEITDGSYSRQAVTTPAQTITLPYSSDGSGGAINYTCDGPNFGVLAGAEVAAWLVLYRLVTNDADSELVAAMPCAYTADGATTAVFTLPATGAVALGLVCPTGWYD